MALLVALALWDGGCERSAASFLDGGADFVPADALLPPADAPALAVDFTVENCPSFDPVALTCTGNVPLSLRFVPLTTSTVANYLWDFGDNSLRNAETAPRHVFTVPGAYTVTIIATGVGGGMATKARAGFIVGAANGPGQACDVSAQCTTGHSCICGTDSPCASGPVRGLCAATCSSGLCSRGEVCAGLATASGPGRLEPWQTDLCLAACVVDDDCLPGLYCRTLRPGPVGSAWVRGCFSRAPVDVGEPCTDANGVLRDDLCVTGLCADLGALGLCTLDCENDPCPLGSDCATFGDGKKLCLRPCSSFSFTCGEDPLLSCVVPSAGDRGYGFPGSATTDPPYYCAPKNCSGDTSCLPAGVCAAKSGDPHCVRQP